MWVAITALAAMVTAAAGAILGFAAWIQKSKEAGAKESATMAQVGVDMMKEAQARQEGYIVRITSELGQAIGALNECKEERQTFMAENRELKAENAAMRVEIATLKREMSETKGRLDQGGL